MRTEPVWTFLVLTTLLVSGARADRLTIRLVDQSGRPITGRVHVRDSGGWVPADPDTALLGHRSWPHMGAYVYVDSSVTLDVAPGPVQIVAGKGFEWKPQAVTVPVSGDTETALSLRRHFDLSATGWHGGDVHVHTIHQPSDYEIRPEDVRRVVEAEDLSMAWLLDGAHEFTGGPHPLSDGEHVFWYSTEFRHQAFGHAALLGLTTSIGFGCCTPPSPAYPLLADVRESWTPTPWQGMVLCHPCTGADFFDDGGWPAWGLGREGPLLAVTGNLDAYDIASYSNEGDVAIDEWYALLSAGLEVPPSAGTDAGINVFWGRPPGGYRVYAQTGEPAIDPTEWVEALRAGRSFVTNYPLIPEFMVDGAPAGARLAVTAGEVEVRFRVRSVLALESAEVIVGGEAISTHALPMTGQVVDQLVVTTVPIEASTWIAVRVTGTTGSWHAVHSELFAHTAPVYVSVPGDTLLDPASARRFLDWAEDLHAFVDQRGNWDQGSDAVHVHGRIEEAADYFRAAFDRPPNPPVLLEPAAGDTVDPRDVTFRWLPSLDPDPGDELRYRVDVRGGPGLPLFFQAGSDTTIKVTFGEETHGPREWRVVVTDLAGNQITAPDGWRPFYLQFDPASLGPDAEQATAYDVLRAHPNPFTDAVRFWRNGGSGPRGPSEPLDGNDDGVRLEVFDVRGRRVQSLAWPPGSGWLHWDGRSVLGSPLPAGTYWARLRTTSTDSRGLRDGRPAAGKPLRITIVR